MFISKAAIDSTYISGVIRKLLFSEKSTGAGFTRGSQFTKLIHEESAWLVAVFPKKNVSNYYSLMNKLNLSSYSVQALSSQLRDTDKVPGAGGTCVLVRVGVDEEANDWR